MSRDFRPTRRQFGAMLFTLLSSAPRCAFGAGRNPKDNGLGGTGYISPMPDPDNGIGGTGVVGTIRGFGSVIVNGLRVSYPADAEVTIDGAAVDASSMRIGHVVSLVAERDGEKVTTGKIQILREAVGAVEAISGRKMQILGQKIELGRNVKNDRLVVGQPVAVSGLRMPDHTIVASLIEPIAPGVSQLVGTLTRSEDGRLAIGGQRLSGVAESMLGRRVVVRGASNDGVLDVSHLSNDAWLPHGPTRFLVETYLQRRGAGMVTATGLDLPQPHDARFDGVVRAVVGFAADPAGGWAVQTFHAAEKLGMRGSANERRGENETPGTETRGGAAPASEGAGAAAPPDFGVPSNQGGAPIDSGGVGPNRFFGPPGFSGSGALPGLPGLPGPGAGPGGPGLPGPGGGPGVLPPLPRR